MTEAEIRHRLCGAKYDCLFDDRRSRRLREYLATRKNAMLNALSRLEQTQQLEPRYFWEEPGRSNLLTFIYWCQGSDSVTKTDEQNRRTLNKFPDNMAALTMRLRSIHTRGNDLGEAKLILEKLAKFEKEANENATSNMMKHILICEGEIAFVFHFLGPALYGEAVDRYEKLLKRYNNSHIIRDSTNASGDDEFDSHICSWHFHLAQTYNRMLNNGGPHLLVGRGRNTLENVYETMCDNLIAILENGNSVYKGKAMIELVDAYKKCKQLAVNNTDGDRRDILAYDDKCPIKFPYKQVSLNDFIQEAMHQAPDDPYVLERCGRHHRQFAETEEEYLKAIDILDKCPSRHVAWHHKGLSYVHLWQTARNEGFQQQQQSSGVRGGRGGRWTRGRGGGSRSGYDDSRNSSFEKARAYMTKAKLCYEEAIRLGGNTCCRYMIDMARACITLGQFEEAERHFVAAEKLTYLVGEVNEFDTSYLYEQWAMLKLKVASGNRHFDIDRTRMSGTTNDATNLYRKSIRAAVLGGLLTERALTKLRELIHKQVIWSQRDEVLRLEDDLLCVTLDYYGDCKQPLVEAVQNSADASVKIWQLVSKLNDKVERSEVDQKYDVVNDICDVNTSFLYLTVLHKAGQLSTTDITNRSRGIRMALNIAKKLCDDRVASNSESGLADEGGSATALLPMRDVFRWAVGNESMRMKGYKNKDESIVDDDFDVCVLSATSSADSEDFTTRLVNILDSRMGLKITSVGAVSNNSGHEVESVLNDDGDYRGADYIDQLIARSKSIIVIVEHDDLELQQLCRWSSANLVPVLDWLYTTPTAKVCVVVNGDDRLLAKGEVDGSGSYNRWPRMNIGDEVDKYPLDVAFSLINAMI